MDSLVVSRRAVVLGLASSLRLAWAQATLTPEQRQQDLRFAVANLPALHVNFFFQLAEADFLAAARQLESDNAALTTTEFYTRLASLFALAGDAHTALQLESSQAGRHGFTLLPIQFRSFAEGVFVTAGRAEWNGLQLAGIGDLRIEDALSRLRHVVPHENPYWFRHRVAGYLRNRGMLEGIGAATPGQPVRYELRTPGDGTVRAEPEAQPGVAVAALNPAMGWVPPTVLRPGDYYWVAHLASARAVYVRYAVCAEMPGRPFAGVAAEAIRLLDTNPVDTFIVDVRANGGGNSAILHALLIPLATRVTRLRRNPRFRVVVLGDGGSFSSGKLAITDMKADRIPAEVAPLVPPDAVPLSATFIGEPTGGKPGNYGETRNASLPASGIGFSYSTKLHPVPDWIPAGDSVYPDIPVTVRAADWFARHDAVLAAALANVEPAAVPQAADSAVRVVNGASQRADEFIAPGSLASVVGVLPAAPGEVAIDGRRAEVVSWTENRIDFVVPQSLNPGPAALEILSGGASAVTATFLVRRSGPGVFLGQEMRSARGALVSITATGHGKLDESGSAPVDVWIGDSRAEVAESMPAPDAPGRWMIRARTPGGLPPGVYPLFISTEGAVSNGVPVVILPAE